MKNSAKVFGLVVVAMVVMSCASHAKWSVDDMSAITKEKTTMKEVQDRFGEPDARSIDSNGNQAWVFKKASDMSENTLLRIGSLGTMGGKNSGGYSDILTVTFNKKSDMVADFKYEEHVSPFSGK